MGLIASLRRNWRVCLVIATPIVLSSLLFTSETQTTKCAFMMGICTVFWITEALPLPMTALLATTMAPMLGVLTSNQVCETFFNDAVMMVMGAIFVASAVEYSNLHRRIALRLLLFIGVQPRRLLFSIVSITGFLSMFIANTAATSMMAPIVHNLIDGQIEARKRLATTLSNSMKRAQKKSETEESKTSLNGNDGHDIVITTDKDNDHHNDNSESPSCSDQHSDTDEHKKTKKIFNLAICYSANIGGIGTLLGTPPNLVLAKVVSDFAHDGRSPITYASWLQFGLPVCFLSMAVAFIWMNFSLFGFKNTITCKTMSNKKEVKLLRNIVMGEYKGLGVMSFHEKVVCGHFIMLLILFITRNPGFVPGWGSFFPPKYVRDSVSSILVSTSLFVWPKSSPRLFWSSDAKDSAASQEKALNWKIVADKFPWGVIFLLGGGFVLAQASKTSGLSSVLVDYLSFVSLLPPWLTVVILTSLTCLITEITSNTVITIIMLPILGDLAMKFGVNPLLYMLPVTAAASMAFMLPVATPPNAIIYALGMVKMSQMIKLGLAMNILGIICINIVVNTAGYWAFSLDTVPSWVLHHDDVTGNVTGATNNSTLFYLFDNTTATIESAFI